MLKAIEADDDDDMTSVIAYIQLAPEKLKLSASDWPC